MWQLAGRIAPEKIESFTKSFNFFENDRKFTIFADDQILYIGGQVIFLPTESR